MAYSSIAISVQAVPTVFDSLSVFLLSAAHFAIAAFVGSSPTYYYAAISAYSSIAIGSTWFMVKTSGEHFSPPFEIRFVRPLLLIKLISGLMFLALSYLFWAGKIGDSFEIPVGVLGQLYATAWIVAYHQITERHIFAGLR